MRRLLFLGREYKCSYILCKNDSTWPNENAIVIVFDVYALRRYIRKSIRTYRGRGKSGYYFECTRVVYGHRKRLLNYYDEGMYLRRTGDSLNPRVYCFCRVCAHHKYVRFRSMYVRIAVL